MKRCWVAVVAALAAAITTTAIPGCAAERDGVTLPDTAQVGGTALVLNGTALRTYSFLGLHVYVAGLYLTARSDDAAAILASPAPKLLSITFRRAVSAAQARGVWRDDLRASCGSPCTLSLQTIDAFLATVTDARLGDRVELTFAPPSLQVAVNGRTVERSDDPQLGRAVLGAFIGPHAGSPAVRRELLGTPE